MTVVVLSQGLFQGLVPGLRSLGHQSPSKNGVEEIIDVNSPQTRATALPRSSCTVLARGAPVQSHYCGHRLMALLAQGETDLGNCWAMDGNAGQCSVLPFNCPS